MRIKDLTNWLHDRFTCHYKGKETVLVMPECPHYKYKKLVYKFPI